MSSFHTFVKASALVALLALGACSSSIKLDDVARSGAGMGAGADVPDAEAGAVAQAGAGHDELTDPNSPLAKRSVYFDFDRYLVKPEYQGMLDQHARYLREHDQRRVLIQGNTDARGTTEYNLALGQKRAEAVRRALSALGVPDGQMEAVSLGKEKPVATESGEASWARNRRADIVY